MFKQPTATLLMSTPAAAEAVLDGGLKTFVMDVPSRLPDRDRYVTESKIVNLLFRHILNAAAEAVRGSGLRTFVREVPSRLPDKYTYQNDSMCTA